MYRSFIKPGFDFCFAFLIICITLPLLFILGFLLFLQNSGTPFFSQVRPGLKEKQFTIYKLKTMQDTRDDQGVLLPDNHRITPLGKIIRKLSLDELPQFWNVLKGDMSFVGPRPLLPEYLPLYNKKQKNRHNLKPGITGWAQVKGRNTISWQQKFEYDLWYIENQSFILDLKILLFTVGKIFKTQEVNASGLNTMERFNGNN
ncbi:MAG: lipopolysaccharide/colanic/teichoic acid biosynthesis glycosyltransferase [Candidatus Arcticimaribacter sp.]|jgi:lipopolysaccharide/colanic/teichoic acid biosynthesis glycosyltransferase